MDYWMEYLCTYSTIRTVFIGIIMFVYENSVLLMFEDESTDEIV